MPVILYLKTNNKPTIQVEMSQTDSGYIIQAVHNPHLKFELVFATPAASENSTVAAFDLPAHRTTKPNVLTMTPQDVIEYFRRSNVLSGLVSDLEIIFYSSEFGSESDLQLKNDLESIKHLKKPSKADISEALTGKRTYGGSTYDRVKAAYDAFYTSTTSTESKTQPDQEKKAA